MTDQTVAPEEAEADFDTSEDVVEELRLGIKKAKGVAAGTIIAFDAVFFTGGRVHGGARPLAAESLGKARNRVTVKKGEFVEVGSPEFNSAVELAFENERVTVQPENVVTYSYAAIFVNGKWYLTGSQGAFGSDEFTNEQFMQLLATNKSVRNARVATGFTAL